VKSKLAWRESWSVLIGVSQHHAQEMAIRPPYLVASPPHPVDEICTDDRLVDLMSLMDIKDSS
jgi:hypothetical protein